MASPSTATSPLRRSAGKSGRSSAHLVFGCVCVVLLLGVFALVVQVLPGSGSARAERTDGQADRRAGVVTLAREGDHCRQMALDNGTGTMKETGRVRCAAAGGAQHGDPSNVMRERYSGGRLDTIRKSFSER